MRICTLIPAYKTQFLRPLFASLRSQTYRNFEVIVSDDSPDGRVTSTIIDLNNESPFPFQTKILTGPKLGTATDNLRSMRRQVSFDRYDLLHVHLDDDVIYPSFYQRHVSAHMVTPLSASVSARWFITDQGHPYRSDPRPGFIENSNQRQLVLPADLLAKTSIPIIYNWTGELSNIVFRPSVFKYVTFEEDCAKLHHGLNDISCLIFGCDKIAYISEKLGGFRQSALNSTGKDFDPGRIASTLGWIALGISAFRLGMISEDDLRSCIRKTVASAERHYAEIESISNMISKIRQCQALPDIINTYETLWRAHISHLFGERFIDP